ncbi:TPA: hypothetical protein DIC20_00530 [Candidatus Dependentiae bacterium]|nr:MAG: hypothetical protein US03_C0002G0044 [candidate division TM6 bacterium GW2011_GWF2_36_131]KKQ03478.1 MAG: hypothetical protein US13_C0002G0044 [candidate division TM6 bacterium GW2011_GWE2_36_25]KKQ20248.1 MAG: hypothetical protein US32_C0001G0145 [candidate division TM6 bacterium GW2011_GWA2_36_9]HBR70787.1 hypothetical protein [Candidatus Dependentiae bacterium]HCU00172.1 hypothetical protein [Candidatus Dependentiae bacterium]
MKICKMFLLSLMSVSLSLRGMDQGSIERYQEIWSTYPTHDVNEKLFSAVVRNDFAEVEKLLKAGADINGSISGPVVIGGTPLNVALLLQLTDMAKFLVRHGADVNSVGFRRITPLAIAVSAGNLDLVRFIIEKGANVNASGEFGETALQFAILNDDLDMVKLLAENHAEVNAFVPVMTYIVGIDTLEELKKMLDEEPLSTALMTAVVHNNPDIIRFLLDNGADPKIFDWFNHDTPITALILAVLKDNAEIAKLLLDHGATLEEIAGSKNIDLFKIFHDFARRHSDDFPGWEKEINELMNRALVLQGERKEETFASIMKHQRTLR